jgi:hypothetical protein
MKVSKYHSLISEELSIFSFSLLYNRSKKHPKSLPDAAYINNEIFSLEQKNQEPATFDFNKKRRILNQEEIDLKEHEEDEAREEKKALTSGIFIDKPKTQSNDSKIPNQAFESKQSLLIFFEDLRKSNEDLRKSNEDLRKLNEDLRKSNENLTKETADLKTQLNENLSKETADLKTQLNENLSKETADLKTQLNESKTQNLILLEKLKIYKTPTYNIWAFMMIPSAFIAFLFYKYKYNK